MKNVSILYILMGSILFKREFYLILAPLMGALALTVVSIAFFNFAGVSITRELGATNRKVLDSLRTLVIWAFSLIIGWQLFYWLQVREKAISQKENIY